MEKIKETDLYSPVKRWLEEQGFEVQAEVGDIDVLGVRRFGAERAREGEAAGDKSIGSAVCASAENGAENGRESNEGEDKQTGKREVKPTGERKGESESRQLTAAVELKLRPSLELLIQAVDRIPAVDLVYIAFPKCKKAPEIRQLCSALGIGILLIEPCLRGSGADRAVLYLEAKGAKGLRRNAQKARLLKEFHSRRLRVNVGGTRGRIMTAYRERAISIAFLMEREGEVSYADLRAFGLENPRNYLYSNYYGWFRPARRGVYVLTEKGRADLLNAEEFRDQLDVFR